MLYLDTNDTRDYECFVTIEMDLVLYRSYEVTVSSRRPGKNSCTAKIATIWQECCWGFKQS